MAVPEDDDREILEYFDGDQFAEDCAEASREARRETLEAGLSVVFLDDEGRCLEELPDGRIFEVRLDPTLPRESCVVRLREVTPQAA